MHSIACVACVHYLIQDGYNGSLEQCSDHVATRSLLYHPPIGHVAIQQKILSNTDVQHLSLNGTMHTDLCT